jgi:hypothetical protein
MNFSGELEKLFFMLISTREEGEEEGQREKEKDKGSGRHPQSERKQRVLKRIFKL